MEIISYDKPKSIAELFSQVEEFKSRKDYPGLFNLLEEIISLTPKDENDWIIQSLANEVLENFDSAVYCLKQAIKIKPNNPFAYYKLYQLYNSTYESDKAEQYRSKWLELDPDRTVELDGREVIKGLKEESDPDY